MRRLISARTHGPRRPKAFAERLLPGLQSHRKWMYLPLITEYLSLRRRYLAIVKSLTKREIQNGDDLAFIRLNQYRILKDAYLDRIVFWYGWLLFVLVCFMCIYFLLGTVSTTPIRVSINVSAVSFRVKLPFNFQADAYRLKPLVGNRVEHNGMTIDPDGNEFLEPAVLITEANQNILLKSLNIPSGATVTIQQPIPKETRLTVQHQDTAAQVNGVLAFLSGRFITDSSISYNRSTGDTMQPYDFLFEKRFNDNIVFNLGINGMAHLDLPQLYVCETLAFNEKSTFNNVHPSSIQSGVIHLLDTNNDSVLLNKGDTLRMDFVGDKPVKILAQIEESTIHLEFEAEVNKLTAGSNIFTDRDKLNQMPSRIKTFYDKVPYGWAILIVVLPLCLTFLVNRRKTI